MSKERLWSLPFFLVFMAEYMLQIGLYGIRPIVSSYAVSLGASLAFAGFLSGLLSGVALLCRPLCGYVSDRLNQMNVLLAASILITASQFGCMLIPSLPAIAFFESVKGVAFTFKSALIISATALLIPKERLGAGIGLISITFTTAGAIGPIVSTALLGSFTYAECYVVAGLVSVLGIVSLIALRVVNPTELQKNNESFDKNIEIDSNEPWWRRFVYIPALPFSFIAGIAGCSYGTSLSMLFLIEEQGYIENAFLYFSVYTGVVIFTRIVGGGIADKRGAVVVIPMLALSLVGSVPLVFSGSYVCMFISALTMALGQGPAFAVLQAEAVRNASKEETAKASNTFLVAMDLGMFAAPVLGGVALDILGFAGFFAGNCLYLLIALLVSTRFILLPTIRAKKALPE